MLFRSDEDWGAAGRLDQLGDDSVRAWLRLEAEPFRQLPRLLEAAAGGGGDEAAHGGEATALVA